MNYSFHLYSEPSKGKCLCHYISCTVYNGYYYKIGRVLLISGLKYEQVGVEYKSIINLVIIMYSIKDVDRFKRLVPLLYPNVENNNYDMTLCFLDTKNFKYTDEWGRKFFNEDQKN